MSYTCQLRPRLFFQDNGIYQIVLVIALVDEISCEALTFVPVGIFRPIAPVRFIVFHDTDDGSRINVGEIKAR